MGSDFSALDAELDALSGGPDVDALTIALSYAGGSSALSDIDAQLEALDADRQLERRAGSAPPLPRFRRSTPPSSADADEGSLPRNEHPDSEEIVLPEPVRDVPRTRDGSGEMPLHMMPESASRSGSFSLAALEEQRREETLEAYDDELIDDDDEGLIELTGAAYLGDKRPSLFDNRAPESAEAQREADAAFAELFAEATKRSSMPSPRNSQLPEQYSDDTETFDTSALASVEARSATREQGARAGERARGAEIVAEELDSAEFEIVLDGDDEQTEEGVAPDLTPSQLPDKRPSFLGRLFGRKEE